MSLSIGELEATLRLKDELTAKLAGVNKTLTSFGNQTTKASEPVSRMTGLLSGLGTQIKATMLGFVGAQAIIGIVMSLTRALGEFVTIGIKLPGIERSFENLAAGMGVQSQAMLDAMRRATIGLVSDFNLMQSANKAMLLGLPVSANEMGKLAETATVLGRAMGLNATQALDDLIKALGRSSPMILDNLGLTVKVGEANRIYAERIGKTSEQLTDAEKKIAFYTAALEKADEKIASLGEQTPTLGEHMSIVWTSIGNVISAGAAKVNEYGGEYVTLIQKINLGDAALNEWSNGLRALNGLGPEFVATVKSIGEQFDVSSRQARALSLSEAELTRIMDELTTPVQENIEQFEQHTKAVEALRDQLSGAALQQDVAILDEAFGQLTVEQRENIATMERAVAAAQAYQAQGATLTAQLAELVKVHEMLRAVTSGLSSDFSNVGVQVGLNLDPLRQLTEEAKFFAEQAAFDAEMASLMATETEAIVPAAEKATEAIKGIGVVATIAYGDLISGAAMAATAVRRSEAEISAAMRAISDAYRDAGIIQHITGPSWMASRVPGFAGGVENFRGGAAIVGERGPELVTLPRGSSVTPNGAVGSVSVSVDARGSFFDTPSGQSRFARMVSDAIDRKLRARGGAVGRA